MKRPSKIKVIKAKRVPWLIWGDFAAITLLGVIYTKKQKTSDTVNSTDGFDSVLEVHEMIHVKQAVSLRDSWFLFYLHYICEWLYNLPLLFANFRAPYKFLPLEVEAYANEYSTSYASQEKCERWRKYRKIGIVKRFRLAKRWYKDKSVYGNMFRNFVKSEMDVLVN